MTTTKTLVNQGSLFADKYHSAAAHSGGGIDSRGFVYTTTKVIGESTHDAANFHPVNGAYTPAISSGGPYSNLTHAMLVVGS